MTNFIYKTLIASVLITFALETYADAKLASSTSTIDFPVSKKIEYFSIQNSGDSKAFVKITVKNVGDLGKANAEIKDASKKEIVIAPNKLILKPGQSRKIKVIKRATPSVRDLFYRVYANPAPMPTKKKELEDKKALGMNLQVGIGTNTLLIIRPKKAEPKLEAKRTGKKLLVKNTGNTTVTLREIQQCEGDNCITYSNRKIFPGSSKQINLQKSNLSVKFVQNNGVNEKTRTVG